MTTKTLFQSKVKKSDASDVVISVSERNNSAYVDIREFVDTPGYSGPTKKGVNFHAENWDEFFAQMVELDKWMKENN